MDDDEPRVLTVTRQPPPAGQGMIGLRAAARRQQDGDNNSDKPANCLGNTCTAPTAPPKKLSREMTGEAKKAAIDSGRGIDHDQQVLNEKANEYEWYSSRGMQASALLSQYQTLQNGNYGTGIAAPLTNSEIPGTFTGEVAKEGAKQVAITAATEGAGRVIAPVVGPAIRYIKGGGTTARAAIEAGEPVSVATGEYLETWRDFYVPATLSCNGARFMGLQLLQRTDYNNPLGLCQTSEFDEFIVSPERGRLTFHQGDGKRIDFERPFNFLPSSNAAYPHFELYAPWLRSLELHDHMIKKYFTKYDDDIYRLEKIEDVNGNATTFYRDCAGNLERAQSTEGLRLAFTNDAQGRRTQIALIGGDGSRLNLASYAYDARSRMIEANCAFGMSVRYFWHAERDLLLSWHNLAKRSETHFTYDDEGRVLHTRTNGIWNDDRFRYDRKNHETTYLPSGDTRLAQRFRYDENDNVTHEIDALGGILQHTFDAAGFETATIDANGYVTTMAYDIRGNVKRHVDAEGRGTTYGWGPHGELDVVIDGAGHIRKYENDEKGNRLSETDAEGHTTRYIRDERGRLLRTILPDGAEESRAYDAHGRLISITDARGGVTRFAHDAFGRVVETTDALGHVTRTEYNAGAGGFATPSAIVRPDGVRVSRAFTADGVLVSVTDGEGRTWTHTYGAFDVLQAIEDPGGGRLSFAHDGAGRVIAVTNQMGVTYHLIRDVAGRVIAEEDFDGRRTEYTRDPGGRVVETTKPDGVRLAYGYDKTDKLTSIRSFAADVGAEAGPLDETHFWYDGRGLLIKASNLAALVEFQRDGNGRIVRETVNGRTVESKLDARGHRIERRIGAGEPGEGLVQIARDPLGMVAAITIDNHAPLAFTRDALGRETRRASAKGFCLDQGWDAVGQLMHQRVGTGEAERRYTWDKAGAPTMIDDAIWGTTRYEYDANGQVAKAQFGDGFTERFRYDAAKNTAGVALEGPGLEPGLAKLFNWNSTPGGVVQLARGPNGEVVALTHDICGRVVKRRVERKGFRPKTWEYSWDAHDRLVRCDNPEGETWFYRYDPFGRRLSKVRMVSDKKLAWTAQKHAALVPASAREATKIWTWPEPPDGTTTFGDARPPVVGTSFTWDGDVLAEEAPIRLDGAVDWEEATRWHNEPDSFHPLAKQTAHDKMLPIATDHLGTPHEMCDEAGRVTWAATHTTWGVVRRVTTPTPANDDGAQAIYSRGVGSGGAMRGNFALAGATEDAREQCPIRFQGQRDDADTGLCYNYYRHYDQTAGQYVSSDPIGLRGGDRPQAYVERVTSRVDVFGLLSSTGRSTIGANKAAGDAMRDVIAAREAPALTEQTFKTVGGKRRVDVLKLGDRTIAIESKVGRTSLGSRERQELARDWWLVRQGQIDGVQWEFSPSAVNGGVGPSSTLQQTIDKLGFTTRINP